MDIDGKMTWGPSDLVFQEVWLSRERIGHKNNMALNIK